MANFSENKINEVWEKAKVVNGQDSNKFRQDFAGAWIQRDKYGKEESFGWEVDHIFPESLGGTDHTSNLQPLQWENNRKKADNFPSFSTAVSSDTTKFAKKDQNWKYPDSFITTLKGLYPNNQTLKKL